MKNKRTKFTAILLSALMAVSTISSVTWAADLFSDGSDGSDVVVEESGEVVSDFEDVADEEDLLGVGDLTGVKSITFKYDKTKGVVADYLLDNGSTATQQKNAEEAKDLPNYVRAATCTSRRAVIYFVQIGNAKVYSTEVNDDGTGTAEGAYAPCLITIDPTCDGGDGYIFNPYAPTPTNHTGNEHLDKNKAYVTRSATCDKEGEKIVYPGCDICGALYVGTKTAFGYTDTDGNGYIDGNETNGDSIETILQKQIENGYDEDLGITKVAIEKTKHNFDGATPQIIWDEYIYKAGNSIINDHKPLFLEDGTPYGKLFVGSDGVNDKKDLELISGEKLAQYKPYKCHMDLDSMEMVPDSQDYKTDAYYYTVVKCNNCGTTYKFDDKKYLIDVPGNFEKGIYFVQAQAEDEDVLDNGNVLGFIGKNGEHFYFADLAVSNTLAGPAGKVNTEDYADYDDDTHNYKGVAERTYDGKLAINSKYLKDPVEPILKDCSKLYRYYVRTVEDDTEEPVDVLVKGNDTGAYAETHAYSNVVVVPKDTKFMDGTVSSTEDSKLLKGGTTKDYTYAETGSKIQLYSKQSIHCNINAKYQEAQKCIVCGKWKKVGDLKETGYNGPHSYDAKDWSQTTDDVDNKYYDLGDGTHKKYTYYHRTCTICGYRDLKLANEYIEAHNLVETKMEDGPKQDPTCGEDGFYTVHLACACGFADKESEKQTRIPATDQHDFGSNEADLILAGEIQVGGRPGDLESDVTNHKITCYVARECTVCHKKDSNGINNTLPKEGHVYPEVDVTLEKTGRTFTDYVAAKQDPSTHITYPCSVGKITINFTWEGKVDGESKRLTKSWTGPYYPNERTFAGARAHQADDVRTENKVDATTEAPGHYDRVVYCSVCGDEVSRETIEIAQIGSAPSIKAVSANYNTINVSWDAVEGADHYRLYYKSSDVGVTTWKLVRTVNGTSFTHSGLVTGAKYRYTVRAVLNGVNGEYDRKGSVAIPKLAAPENVAVTSVSGKNKVSWSKVDGANGYIIQRSTGNGWTRVGAVKKGAKVTWTDKKPVSGATYRVRAYRTVNDANFSKNNVYSSFSAAK